MKKWFALLMALLLVAFVVSPALADGPHPINPFRSTYSPLGTITGFAFGFVHSILMALAVAALGVLVVILLPSQTKRVSETAEKSLAPSLGIGCVTLLAAVPLFVLLLLLIVTIPAALALPIVIAAAWLFGWIALGWAVGEKVLEAAKASDSYRVPTIAVAVGVLLLGVIGTIPLVGWFFGLVVGSIGLGAVVLTLLNARGFQISIGPSAGVGTGQS